MHEFINYYSAALLVLFLVVFGGIVVWQYRKKGWVLGMIAIVAVALVVGYTQLRTGTHSIASASALNAELGNGTPILVEVYSDF